MRAAKVTILCLQWLILGSVLSYDATAVAAQDSAALTAIPNLKQPQPNRFAGGALDAASIKRLPEAGIKHVINLRTEQETPDFDEARAAAEQAVSYHALPIAGSAALTRENVRKFDELLTQIADEPTLIHCASGNRVGALIALREAWIKGRSVDAAIEEGKRWGLAGMEEAVRMKLAQ